MATAKEYLRQIREEQVEARALMQKREETRLSLYPKAITYTGDKVQTSPGDILSERMAKLCEMDNALEAQLKKLDRRRAEAARIAYKIDDSKCRQLITLYYLSTKTTGELLRWKDVADIMGYHEKHVVQYLHPKALREFSEKM
jgi:hypothetical protein